MPQHVEVRIRHAAGSNVHVSQGVLFQCHFPASADLLRSCALDAYAGLAHTGTVHNCARGQLKLGSGIGIAHSVSSWAYRN